MFVMHRQCLFLNTKTLFFKQCLKTVNSNAQEDCTRYQYRNMVPVSSTSFLVATLPWPMKIERNRRDRRRLFYYCN